MFNNPGTVGLTNAPGFIVMEVNGKMIKSIDFRQISYDAREAVNADIQNGMPGFDAVSNIWLKDI
jgi:hypothetical protein